MGFKCFESRIRTFPSAELRIWHEQDHWDLFLLYIQSPGSQTMEIPLCFPAQLLDIVSGKFSFFPVMSLAFWTLGNFSLFCYPAPSPWSTTVVHSLKAQSTSEWFLSALFSCLQLCTWRRPEDQRGLSRLSCPVCSIWVATPVHLVKAIGKHGWVGADLLCSWCSVPTHSHYRFIESSAALLTPSLTDSSSFHHSVRNESFHGSLISWEGLITLWNLVYLGFFVSSYLWWIFLKTTICRLTTLFSLLGYEWVSCDSLQPNWKEKSLLCSFNMIPLMFFKIIFILEQTQIYGKVGSLARNFFLLNHLRESCQYNALSSLNTLVCISYKQVHLPI